MKLTRTGDKETWKSKLRFKDKQTLALWEMGGGECPKQAGKCVNLPGRTEPGMSKGRKGQG